MPEIGTDSQTKRESPLGTQNESSCAILRLRPKWNLGYFAISGHPASPSKDNLVGTE
jgi:hypothetical protein